MIETNLNLIPCELEHFNAALSGQQQLGQMLGVSTGWLEFPEALCGGCAHL